MPYLITYTSRKVDIKNALERLVTLTLSVMDGRYISVYMFNDF